MLISTIGGNFQKRAKRQPKRKDPQFVGNIPFNFLINDEEKTEKKHIGKG
jgi:hypothetical protein